MILICQAWVSLLTLGLENLVGPFAFPLWPDVWSVPMRPRRLSLICGLMGLALQRGGTFSRKHLCRIVEPSMVGVSSCWYKARGDRALSRLL